MNSERLKKIPHVTEKSHTTTIPPKTFFGHRKTTDRTRSFFLSAKAMKTLQTKGAIGAASAAQPACTALEKLG
jgi:hypothetical protein